MHRKPTIHLAVLVAAAATFLTAGGASATPAPVAASPVVAECEPGAGNHSAARVREGATAKEPALYSTNEAKAYGVIKDSPRLANGSVTVPTVFHMISDHELSAAEKARWNTLISAQMTVLNDSFAGRTAADASDTPFRFSLVDTRWTVNSTWYTVVPGKNERDMKKALYTGDSRTLNVYAANIGDGLLGWAYFPKG